MSLVSIVKGNNFQDGIERSSITFIVDRDQDGDPYFSLAQEYYLTDEKNQTDYVVDDCKSLECILESLTRLSKNNSTPWGKINIVVHGNPWTGLSLYTTECSENRTMTQSIITELVNGNLPTLDKWIIDDESVIEFIACGLGQNEVLIEALRMAFVGWSKAPAEVLSSSFFINFFRHEDGHVERRNLEPHYAFYRTAYRPANLHIAEQLTQRYPQKSIDWMSSIDKNEWQDRSEVFSKRFNVPVDWRVSLTASSHYEWNTESDKIDFISDQKDLVEVLEAYSIPIEKFRWNISKEKNYIHIKGKATVLCILQEMTVS